jgi:hypothetical protein
MIEREELNYYENIINTTNSNIDLSIVDKILYYIEHEKDNELLKLILHLSNPTINDEYLFKVINLIKERPDLKNNVLDSFSNNQITAKTALINAVDDLKELDKESTVVIWGSWYGSVLIPMLADKVKKIVCIDLDPEPLQIAKNRLFDNYKNVDYVCDDVFKTYRDVYLNTNLIINTSCEHMPPMKGWKWFGAGALEKDTDTSVFRTPKLPKDCYFAFQSNNMFGIEGHINCVNSIEEFKEQLPERAVVLYEEEVEDTRGTRYMLVGKFMPL